MLDVAVVLLVWLFVLFYVYHRLAVTNGSVRYTPVCTLFWKDLSL
jgi:hypothetical protein